MRKSNENNIYIIIMIYNERNVGSLRSIPSATLANFLIASTYMHVLAGLAIKRQTPAQKTNALPLGNSDPAWFNKYCLFQKVQLGMIMNN